MAFAKIGLKLGEPLFYTATTLYYVIHELTARDLQP
jgi:hypothetical protein